MPFIGVGRQDGSKEGLNWAPVQELFDPAHYTYSRAR